MTGAVTRAGRPLPCRSAGSSAGTPVLALHGFGGGPASFDDVAAAGLRARLRAATLPGHGDVDACSFDEAVDRVAATVGPGGHEHGEVLWGYSLGARLALAATLAGARVRALILESGRATVDDEARAAVDDARADDLERRGVAAFFADWEQGPLFAHLDAEQRRRRQSLRSGHDARRLAAALRAFSPGRQRPPVLASLRLPVLLLAGAADAAYVQHAKQMAMNLPAARLFIIDGCGHIPHVERPDVVARIVNDFLAVTAVTAENTQEPRP